MPTRSVHGYSFEKVFYWGDMNAAARVTKTRFSGRRTCIDIFSSFGVNEDDKTAELSWGTALLSLHADDKYDRYIFCDIEAVATNVLSQRVETLFGGAGAVVYPMALGSETLGSEIAKMAAEHPTGPEVLDHPDG